MRQLVTAFLFLFSAVVLSAGEYRLQIYVAEKPGKTPFFTMVSHDDPKIKQMFEEAYFSAEVPNLEPGKPQKITKSSKSDKQDVTVPIECGNIVSATLSKTPDNQIECEVIYRNVVPKHVKETDSVGTEESKIVSTKLRGIGQWTIIGVPVKNCGENPSLVVMACRLISL